MEVMQSLGCRTVAAELRSGDLDIRGGTRTLASMIYKDPSQALYDALNTGNGRTAWYGFAFRTHPGYLPNPDPSSPNWNAIFTWHGSIEGGGNPIGIGIAAKGWTNLNGAQLTNSSGYTAWPDGRPHVVLEVNGGDSAKWPTGGATALRFAGPPFEPGHLYRFEMKVTWSDSYQGAIEWWVDGVKYADVTGISNLQVTNGVHGNVWPTFENYRPYTSSFSGTIINYYGGLITGSTRTDVTVP